MMKKKKKKEDRAYSKKRSKIIVKQNEKEIIWEPNSGNDLKLRAITESLQILSPEGKIEARKVPEITNERLLSAYRNMLLTRMLDERLVSLQRQGRLGTYVACSGQEASQIGCVMALSQKDWIFPMYRDTGMIIEMGVPLETLLNRLFGNSQDDALGRDLPNLYGWKRYRIASFAAPIASHVPLAVGFALAAKIRGDDLVTLTTFGDGATSSGEFHSAMNFAGVFKAPTVFVCENNQYAISVPVERQTASSSIAIKAAAYGFGGVRVDGNDLFAVYSTVKDAVNKARKESLPTLVECVTYRLQSHSTADDWKRYRSAEEVERWRHLDPLKRLRLYMQNVRKIWSEEKEVKLREELEGTLSSTISKAAAIPPPEMKTMFEDVYSEMPWNLKEGLEELEELEK